METNLKLPINSTILIDSNFLIDYFSSENKYLKFLTQVKRDNCTLVSIDLVKAEFIRTKHQDILKQKAALFNQIIEAILPIDQSTINLIQPTIEEYGFDSEGVSVVDFYLACCLKRYKGLYLLTRNHKDFPVRIFSRSYLFSIELPKDIRTYALYSYKTESDEIIEELNPDDIPF